MKHVELVVAAHDFEAAFAVLSRHRVLDNAADLGGVSHAKEVRAGVLILKTLALAQSTLLPRLVRLYHLVNQRVLGRRSCVSQPGIGQVVRTLRLLLQLGRLQGRLLRWRLARLVMLLLLRLCGLVAILLLLLLLDRLGLVVLPTALLNVGICLGRLAHISGLVVLGRRLLWLVFCTRIGLGLLKRTFVTFVVKLHS